MAAVTGLEQSLGSPESDTYPVSLQLTNCTIAVCSIRSSAILSLSDQLLKMSNSSADDSGSRFSPVDDQHLGGVLWITASLSLTYFLMSCILRIVIYYRQLTKDTICLVVATVCGHHLHSATTASVEDARIDLSHLDLWFHPSNACVLSTAFGLRYFN